MVKATNIPGQMTPPKMGTNDIRGIKPPVEIASGWTWILWALGASALLAVVWAAWRVWRNRRTQLQAPSVVPAHIRARQRLEDALALLGEPKRFCTLVSDTIRVYLEERFEFHAPERTTEEFLLELQGTNLLTRDQKDSLGDFLQCCDLVKFAQYEPGEPELRSLHGAALRLVDETEPPPALAPGSESRLEAIGNR